MAARSPLMLGCLAGCALSWLAVAPMPAAAQGQPVIMMGLCGAYGYQPVCASVKGALVTYVNACAAQNAGARVTGNGACPEACPMIFKPVCARDTGGNRKTFGNDCLARLAGAKPIRNGRCLR
jgi:hypothetical protein